MKKKKDINLLKQQISLNLLKHKEEIYKRIKEIENEFDMLEDKLKNWDEYYEKEMSLFFPLITIKNENDRNYFYIYFRVNNKKWTKEVEDDLNLTLDFTDEDLEYISHYIDTINLRALKTIMTCEQYNKLMGFVKKTGE